MPYYRYIGEKPENLAQVGPVEPGQVILVNEDLAAGLERCGTGSYEPVEEAEGAAALDSQKKAAVKEKAAKTAKSSPKGRPKVDDSKSETLGDDGSGGE